MGKKVVIVGVVYIVILMIIFAVLASRGERIEFYTIDMMEDSTMESITVSCNQFDESVISTEELYDEFLDDCEIGTTMDFTESYFFDKVLIVDFYEGPQTRQPRRYFDYYWHVDGYEVIKVSHKNQLFTEREEIFVINLLELNKEDVSSSNILFD